MGLPRITLDFIVRNLGKSKKMLELGNQRIRGNVCTAHKTGKAFFTEFGFEHTSIDMNEKDGALGLDLNKPVFGIGKFDVITNSGTSGYVKNQDMCFKNIDSLCGMGGRMIHIVPEKGSQWAGEHYTEEFFKALADKYNYRIDVSKTIEG